MRRTPLRFVHDGLGHRADLGSNRGPLRAGSNHDVQHHLFLAVHFAVFPPLQPGFWSLAVLRFLAGVGIGGEWSIGASLVSEEWPEDRRTKGGAWMHTGYYFGFLAAVANYFIGSRFGWRYMFVVGGLPAILVGFIRNNVQEPQRWVSKAEDLGKQWRMHHAFLELFHLAISGAPSSIRST